MYSFRIRIRILCKDIHTHAKTPCHTYSHAYGLVIYWTVFFIYLFLFIFLDYLCRAIVLYCSRFLFFFIFIFSFISVIAKYSEHENRNLDRLKWILKLIERFLFAYSWFSDFNHAVEHFRIYLFGWKLFGHCFADANSTQTNKHFETNLKTFFHSK